MSCKPDEASKGTTAILMAIEARGPVAAFEPDSIGLAAAMDPHGHELQGLLFKLKTAKVSIRDFRAAVKAARAPEKSAAELARPAELGGFMPREGTVELTGLWNAERFLFSYGEIARHSPVLGGWLCFNGKRWADNGPEARLWAQDVARTIAGNRGGSKDEEGHAEYIQGGAGLREMLDLAEPAAFTPADIFDVDPFLFNCANGTIDLRTGELRPHVAADLLTRISPVAFDPAAKCPRFDAFLERVQPDPEMRAFLQRLAGYSMTGSIGEHVFPICYGVGRNGKGVFVNVVAGVLDIGSAGTGYAVAMPPDLLMKKKDGAHPTGFMTLRGKRLAVSVEPKEGCELDVAAVKLLTGGDPITARYMRQDFVTFQPTHTPWLVTNHKPRIAETKNAIWSRVLLILWRVALPEAEQVKDLDKALLLEEAPGILAWLVRGCLEYQRVGILPPASVVEDSAAYREQQDVLGAFLDAHCVREVGAKITRRELFAAYTEWAEQNGESEETLSTGAAFAEKVREHGIEDMKSVRPAGGGNPDRGWRGIRLMTSNEKVYAHAKAAAEADRVEAEAAGAPPAEGANLEVGDIYEPGVVRCPSGGACRDLICDYGHPICGACHRRRGAATGACSCA